MHTSYPRKIHTVQANAPDRLAAPYTIFLIHCRCPPDHVTFPALRQRIVFLEVPLFSGSSPISQIIFQHVKRFVALVRRSPCLFTTHFNNTIIFFCLRTHKILLVLPFFFPSTQLSSNPALDRGCRLGRRHRGDRVGGRRLWRRRARDQHGWRSHSDGCARRCKQLDAFSLFLLLLASIISKF